MNQLYEIIQTITLTEKATMLGETLNQYVFRVAPRANKLQIKQAVEQLLGKKVASVNTANYAGKARRQRRADAGRTAHWKKAVVTLKEGEKIELA
jgi:large subunit ribosomal protein L23